MKTYMAYFVAFWFQNWGGRVFLGALILLAIPQDTLIESIVLVALPMFLIPSIVMGREEYTRDVIETAKNEMRDEWRESGIRNEPPPTSPAPPAQRQKTAEEEAFDRQFGNR